MSFNPDDNSSPVKFNPNKNTSYNSGDVNARPTGDPKSKKEFKKLLQNANVDADDPDEIIALSEESEEELEADDAVSKKKGPPPTLFDLTSGKAAPKSKLPQNFLAGESASEIADENKTVTPSALFSKMSSIDSKREEQIESSNLEEAKAEEEQVANATAFPPLKTDKDKFTMRFDTPQSDLSYINPMATAKQSIDASSVTEKADISTSNLQEIITQLIDKVEEMKYSGQTDTTVTLKQPPLFAGANIVVSSYESAKGEFNISFQNLTQQAKDLLDMRANQESLRLALVEKGYAVHIISTTTLVENRPIIPSDVQAQRDRDQSQRERERRQKEEEG